MRDKVSVSYEGYTIGAEVFAIDWMEDKVIQGVVVGVDIRDYARDGYNVYHVESYYVNYEASQFESESACEDRLGRIETPDALYDNRLDALEALYTALEEDLQKQSEDIHKMSRVLAEIKKQYKELKGNRNA